VVLEVRASTTIAGRHLDAGDQIVVWPGRRIDAVLRLEDDFDAIERAEQSGLLVRVSRSSFLHLEK
jgi:hypothetical protein